MIIREDSNFIEYVSAPWDGGPLAVPANSITKLEAADESAATLLLGRFEGECSKIGYTSTRVNSGCVHIAKALVQSGYGMTETVMKVSGSLSKIPIDETMFGKFSFQLADKDDYATIADYAVKYFNHGKFHEDPLIGKSAANARNINMVNDLTKTCITHIGKVSNNIIGFMILKKEGCVVDLLLGGMHPDFRHFSYAFWNRVFQEYDGAGVKKFTTTISAANVPIVNLYSRFGFRFDQALLGYRKFRQS